MMFAIQSFFVVRAWICTSYANRLFPNQSSQLAAFCQAVDIDSLTVAPCALGKSSTFSRCRLTCQFWSKGTSNILTIKPFSHPRF
ncbi:hypothetical protein EV421DRAFT_1802147 [Armillaria borealis]|uniref:Secreted protein n=1 Tax=Armillaria borealis TaxID=47425 RepID=A0AA39MRM6_9AGAR|nr:hypothetical protein EV421DRAFT_1802147 [Armillaria borealis]